MPAYVILKTPKFLSKAQLKWTVKKLNFKDVDWKRSNIIFIVPAITEVTGQLEELKIMNAGANEEKLHKECLITVGATASFEQLIQAALSNEVLSKLKEYGFTTINFQCGGSLHVFHELKADVEKTYGMVLKGFAFKREGLHEDIKALKENPGKSEKGLAISHAGAGTILDVLRMGVPLIVVPNPALLDNHQLELAQELQAQGYATQGDLDGLKYAIEKACSLAQKAWGHENFVQGVAPIMDQVVGYNPPTEEEVREGDLIFKEG